jgi:pyridoxal phosphate-dependent aminotransferase EpsN
MLDTDLLVWLKWTRVFLDPEGQYKEIEYVNETFASNWIAPVGPHIDAFEREICNYTGATHAVALSSGTATIHLALKLLI